MYIALFPASLQRNQAMNRNLIKLENWELKGEKKKLQNPRKNY
jgi:hypothetical protein